MFTNPDIDFADPPDIVARGPAGLVEINVPDLPAGRGLARQPSGALNNTMM